jgi:hypothetical protein
MVVLAIDLKVRDAAMSLEVEACPGTRFINSIPKAWLSECEDDGVGLLSPQQSSWMAMLSRFGRVSGASA